MALASSGPISLSGSVSGQSIYLELQSLYTGNPTISLQDSFVKGLAQKPTSNTITIPGDFYDKQKTMQNAILNNTNISATCTSTTNCNTSIAEGDRPTVSVTGGIYPLTYSWSRTGANTSPTITILSPTSATTGFSATGIPPCTQISTTFRCTITDFTGATINSNEVTVTFTNNGTAPGDPPCNL